jgi:hypothetical protein
MPLDDPFSTCLPDFDLAHAARAAIERALVTIEIALGPPTGWRLEQLTAAIGAFRLRRFAEAMQRARDATLPFEQVPLECRCLHTGPGLRSVREAVKRLSRDG